MNVVPENPPLGFTVRYPDEPFEVYVGPHYFHTDGDGLVGGFRAKHHHGNSAGFVHGGALSAFADSVLTGVALNEVDTSETWVATVSLTLEFVSPVTVGDWVECRGKVTRLTRTLAFVRGEITVGGDIALTCSTVLKLTRKR